ncbi:MAG: hypothetical protein HY253_01760, partial [Burkholderiales bacterium]|nr:hypothetical protein [Burkholderiales bacterium]
MTAISMDACIPIDAQQVPSHPTSPPPSTTSATPAYSYPEASPRRRRVRDLQDPIQAQLKSWGMALLPRLIGIALLRLVWAIIAEKNADLPSPWFTL